MYQFYMIGVMIDLFDTQNTAIGAPQDGALPVFMQIAEHVARQISAGHLIPDTKLPPERDMAASYYVDVGT